MGKSASDQPTIIEPAVAPIIYADDVAFEFRDETVWVHILINTGEILVRQAVLVLTKKGFAAALAKANVEARATEPPDASQVSAKHH